MDCRAVLLFCLAIWLAVLVVTTEGRTKKVVIHVPYKVKKIKHTHTVFKTIHHHHSHHDHLDHLSPSPSEDHEHFHHMHLNDELPLHTPVSGMAIPEFLPDVPMDIPIDLPDMPREIPLPHRIQIPLFRRGLV